MMGKRNARLNTEQKRTLLILVIIGVLYFCALIPANLTGAETADMLEVFEVDEYAQYPHLIRMLTPGDSLYQTLRNFFIYLHYYYGYPFYFWSAIFVLPLKLIPGVFPGNTRVIVCVLRQCISVLPVILSAGLLVWITTRFKRTVTAVLLDVLILTMPAVLQNDFWWHPDSLSLFFLTLTFFFLDRDRLRCGRDFLFAAAGCGAAIGTKYLGLYFCLAVPAYLICARVHGSISTKRMFAAAGLFLAVMALFILVSDPLLLLPQERAEIIATMKTQTELSGVGIFLRYDSAFLEDGRIPAWLTENYLRLPMLILAIAGVIRCIIRADAEVRTMAIVTAVYIVTACTVNLNTAAKRLHYFLPILLPLSVWLSFGLPREERRRRVLEALLCLCVAVQIGVNVKTDIGLYQTQLTREEDSASIALYQTLEDEYLPLPEVPTERMTRVYRDWKAYFPEQEGYAVKVEWELADQSLIDEWHPDLILLDKENIRAYGTASAVENAVNPVRMAGIASFYASAAEKSIPGYRFLCENSFGMVFKKDAE